MSRYDAMVLAAMFGSVALIAIAGAAVEIAKAWGCK